MFGHFGSISSHSAARQSGQGGGLPSWQEAQSTGKQGVWKIQACEYMYKNVGILYRRN